MPLEGFGVFQILDIWDFSLTEEEMAKVAAKDLGHSEIVNHSDPAFVKFLNRRTL